MELSRFKYEDIFGQVSNFLNENLGMIASFEKANQMIHEAFGILHFLTTTKN